MRRGTFRKIVVLTCCVCLIYILLSMYTVGGLSKSDISSDLQIAHVTMKNIPYIVNYTRKNTNIRIDINHNRSVEETSERRTTSTKLEQMSSLNISRDENNSVILRPKMTSKGRYGTIDNPLNFIPKSDKTHVVPYISENITRKYLALPEMNYTQNILIVSPIRNAEMSLERFKGQLAKLSYPHHLISMYFGESGSTDNTVKKAWEISNHLRKNHHFRESKIIRLNMTGGIHGADKIRHKKSYQLYRRSHLATVRNRLVHYALSHGRSFDHVLWIDSDVEEFPVDLIQQMLFAESDVVATPCLIKSKGLKSLYDCNSWRETRLSMHHQSLMPPDEIVLECYTKDTERIFLPNLKREGRVVKLDGVGGCALMIKADCFRSGLQFPDVLYKRHIETEGLAKMALDMGYSVVGLPFLEVFHQKPS